jgi:membrane protein DedA with SNARE-associated domain
VLESLITRWGYLAVGVGTFFEGETILIAAGALAHRGLLSLWLVVLAAFVGSVAGDQLWFHLGRRFGRALIDRRPRWKERSVRAQEWLTRYGSVFVLGFRFIYGIRTVTPVLLGASNFPTRRFTLLNTAGGAVWALLFGGLGWALGASLQGLLARTAEVEELALAAILLVALGVGVFYLIRRFSR